MTVVLFENRIDNEEEYPLNNFLTDDDRWSYVYTHRVIKINNNKNTHTHIHTNSQTKKKLNKRTNGGIEKKISRYKI